jgi:regulation of enolase protein 1 (concanavalin A-like superfamily)
MKKTLVLTLFAIAAAACGSNTIDNNRPEPSANRPANSAPNLTSNANANSAPAAGVKVTGPVDHKFDATGIPKGWKWIDADAAKGLVKYETSGGTLKFTVPSGKDMFGENRTAPHMLQPIEGDFQIETRVRFDPKEDYQGAGLFVYKDADNYLRLERAFGGVGGSGSGIRLDARTKDEYKAITTPDQAVTAAKIVDLKLIRIGKKYIGFWRMDEESEWKEVGEFDSDYPDTVQVGIIACNTGADIPVEFLYIKLAPAM